MATFAGADRARRATKLVVAAGVAAAVAACGRAQPHDPIAKLHALLREPVATPSACAGQVSGSTVGRRSPWVGSIDISVFLAPASVDAQHALAPRLQSLPGVRTVYFESSDEAYAEFQRLYTCSADVARTQVPASYRIVLARVTRPQRDAIVARIETLPGVTSVACDPSSPCTSVPPAR